MSLDYTNTTSTCYPEPATSSGHLGLLHLGDESVIRPLNASSVSLLAFLPRYCLPHHQHLGPSQAPLGAPLAPRVYFLRLCFCVQAYRRPNSGNSRSCALLEPQVPRAPLALRVYFLHLHICV